MYAAAEERYERMQYRRSGRSGLKLPAISLGLWHNFGHDRPVDSSRAIVRDRERDQHLGPLEQRLIRSTGGRDRSERPGFVRRR